MLLFVLGRFIVNHVGFLRRCCIPAPVVGGLIFAIFHLVVHQTGLLTLTFDETLKNVFMIWFFTSVGYGASFKVLRRGAGPVLVFLLLLIFAIRGMSLAVNRLFPEPPAPPNRRRPPSRPPTISPA